MIPLFFVGKHNFILNISTEVFILILIESPNNPTIKEIRSLKNQKFRDLTKLFFVEGLRIVQESLSYPSQLKYIIISESFFQNNKFTKTLLTYTKTTNKILQVSDKIFNTLTDTKNPQGIISVMKQPIYDAKSLIQQKEFFLLLDCLQDPGNMGTIIRTADAAKVDAIFVSNGSVDIYNPKVLRATMGSIFHIPVIPYKDLFDLISNFKTNNTKIIASHLNADKNIYETNLNQKIAIVVGNEGNGISNEIIALSDSLIKIPMPGKADSLNASIATAIIIYEILRQKNITNSI